MLRKRDAQGLSMNIIVLAVIGLIVLVVLIGILTGKLTFYTSGVNELTTCESTCKNIGYKSSNIFSEEGCTINGGKSLPGAFSDVSGTFAHGPKKICCCQN